MKEVVSANNNHCGGSIFCLHTQATAQSAASPPSAAPPAAVGDAEAAVAPGANPERARQLAQAVAEQVSSSAHENTPSVNVGEV